MVLAYEIRKLNHKVIKVMLRDNLSYSLDKYTIENDCIHGSINGEFGRIIPFSAIIAIEYKM